MLTAESQHANQDPDGGSHPINMVALGGWCVAVAQLCAVTHFHWYGEETKTGVNQLEKKSGLLYTMGLNSLSLLLHIHKSQEETQSKHGTFTNNNLLIFSCLSVLSLHP